MENFNPFHFTHSLLEPACKVSGSDPEKWNISVGSIRHKGRFKRAPRRPYSRAVWVEADVQMYTPHDKQHQGSDRVQTVNKDLHIGGNPESAHINESHHTTTFFLPASEKFCTFSWGGNAHFYVALTHCHVDPDLWEPYE